RDATVTGVQTCALPILLRVRDQRAGVDPPADDQLVARHHLVAEDADGRADDADGDMTGRAVREQLADALHAGEHGAGPDDDRDQIGRAAWRERDADIEG